MMGYRSDENRRKNKFVIERLPFTFKQVLQFLEPFTVTKFLWTYCYHFKLILQNIISFSWLKVDCTTILTVLTHHYLQTYN